MRHIEEARKLLGKPFRHRGRGPKFYDCIGLLVAAFKAAGRDLEDRKVYGREPSADELERELERQFGPPVASPPQVGDIGAFRFNGGIHHVGLFGDYPHGGLSLIHASGEMRKVTEHRFTGSRWEKQLVFIFRP